MELPGWYLIAYDIAHPRRLQRLHRMLRTAALAVQESVFLVHGTQTDVECLLDRLETLMDPREDDLRAYPVSDPAHLWLSGKGTIQGTLLSDADQPRVQRAPPVPSGWRHWLSTNKLKPARL